MYRLVGLEKTPEEGQKRDFGRSCTSSRRTDYCAREDRHTHVSIVTSSCGAVLVLVSLQELAPTNVPHSGCASRGDQPSLWRYQTLLPSAFWFVVTKCEQVAVSACNWHSSHSYRLHSCHSIPLVSSRLRGCRRWC